MTAVADAVMAEQPRLLTPEPQPMPLPGARIGRMFDLMADR
jgi:hypothetical protein